MTAAAATRLVGRNRELAALKELVSGVVSGHGGICWVEGEPGIGKSALLDAVGREASDRGCTVLRGVADQLMDRFPLRLIADCLGVSRRVQDKARLQVAALLRGDQTVPGVFDPVLAAGERMLELVDRMATDTPLVLILDDLQWADEQSLLLWSRLTQAADQASLLLIGACRPAPRRSHVSRLREMRPQRGGVLLDLGPLDDDSAARIAADLIGGLPGPRLSAELGRAGGNPLYLRELVNALVLDGLVEITDEAAELRADAEIASDSLVATIGRRLSFLTESTSQMLRMAALLGAEFDVRELASLTGRTVSQLAGSFDEAATAGVLDGDGERMTFRHDLIRLVLTEQVPAALRAALHTQLARAAADAGQGIDRVASHLLAVPEGLDDWAARWLATLPESVLYAAPQVSVELLTRAVRRLPDSDPQWPALAALLAQLLFWIGRDQEVREEVPGLLHRITDPELTARTTLCLARGAGRLGRFQEGVDVLAAALEDGRFSPAWRATFGAWAATGLAYLRRPDEACGLARQALQQARGCGDPLAVGYALIASTVLARVGGVAADPAQFDEALAILGDDAESLDLRMMAQVERVAFLALHGRRREAYAATQELLVLAEQIGTYRAAAVTATAMEVCYSQGEWDEALVHLAGIDDEYLKNPALHHLHGLAAVVALHREDLDRARAHLRAAGVDAASHEPGPPTADPFVMVALAVIAEAEGDVDRARTLRAAWLGQPPVRRYVCHQEAPYLVRLSLATGDRATAEAVVAACQERPNGLTDVTLAARCCRALLADDVAGLLAVAAGYRAGGWMLCAGFALEEAALRQAERGQAAAAKESFADAVRTYADLGATWDVRRASARLRPFGVRRGPRGAQRRAAFGWEALTPSEQRVVDLVAKGMSNSDIAAKLFVSRNTIQTHMSNILRKLDLRSRVEVVREAAERGR
jgi:DNA-binding CsgD family transcriptional regulator